MAIFTLHRGNQYSLTEGATHANKLTSSVNLTVSDQLGNTGPSVAFDGSSDTTVILGAGIAAATLSAAEALVLPENNKGPANGLFIYNPGS